MLKQESMWKPGDPLDWYSLCSECLALVGRGDEGSEEEQSVGFQNFLHGIPMPDP
jgi:hypothetical protein